MNTSAFITDVVKTVDELSRSRYCDDGGVRLSYDSIEDGEFKLLASVIIKRFNAKMRRYSDSEFLAEVNGVYVFIYIENYSQRFLRPWVVSITVNEDLCDFGEACDDVKVLHDLFK